MLVSKTPFRVSFFGGGTDFPEYFDKHGADIIGTTIDKYIYITASNLQTKIFKQAFRIYYSKKEFVKSTKSIKHKIIKNALEKYSIKEPLEFHLISNLPSFSGLGSSSSFSAGFINLMNSLNNCHKSKKKLASETINFERNIMKESVGYQDQIFAIYGGFNSIHLRKKFFNVKKFDLTRKDIKKIEMNSFLVHTGIARKAEKIEMKKIKKIEKNKDILNNIRDIAKEAIKYLNNEKLDICFEDMLNESWEQKMKLDNNVSNKQINSFYAKCISEGATAGKLLGAGAGGFMYM